MAKSRFTPKNKLSNVTKLNDNDIMPFGKHKGKNLGTIPDSYWNWFLEQPWAKDYKDLLQYAQLVEKDDE